MNCSQQTISWKLLSLYSAIRSVLCYVASCSRVRSGNRRAAEFSCATRRPEQQLTL
jgi:hypothetical protein